MIRKRGAIPALAVAAAVAAARRVADRTLAGLQSSEVTVVPEPMEPQTPLTERPRTAVAVVPRTALRVTAQTVRLSSGR